MKIVRSTLLAVALSCFVVDGASAQFETGNSLHELCLGSETWKEAVCFGYILGVSDRAETSGTVCLPPGVAKGQLKDVVDFWEKLPCN
jgi:Rap1a immunity proteins